MLPDAALRDLDGRLRVAQARARNVGRLRVSLREAERREFDAHERVRDLTPVLEKESRDVTELEASQLTQLFLSVLGTKAARLAKEKQEYVAAKLKYDEAVLAAEGAHLQADQLRTTLASLEGAEEAYERLLAEKDALIFAAKSPRVAALLGSTDRFGVLEAEARELVEAIQAGEAALAGLDALSDALSTADGAGVDAARAQAHDTQALLDRFVDELADAGARLELSIDGVAELSTFTDAFLDGLVADWVVQSKIDRAAGAVTTAADRVADALAACRHRLAEVEVAVEDLGIERRAALAT